MDGTPAPSGSAAHTLRADRLATPWRPDRDAAGAVPHDAPAGGGCDGGNKTCRPYRGKLPDAAILIDAMHTAGWVQAKAARLLSLTPRQAAYALERHGIDVKKF